MKKHFQLLVLSGCLTFFGVAAIARPPIIIGSGVSIPQLNATNVGTIFTITNGAITQDFIIAGDLEIYDLHDLKFNELTITVGNDLTFSQCSGLASMSVLLILAI